MRILHINRNYIDTPLHQLMVERIEKNGYENIVFVPRLYNEESTVIPNSNVIVRECFSNWHRFLYRYKQRKIINAAESALDFDGYDLIHAYTLFTDGNCARELSKKHGIPYVVAVRNTDVNGFFRLMPHLRKRGIKILVDAKAIFFLSESYREQVFNKYIPSKYRDKLFLKTFIVPNGIDDFWFNNNPPIKKSLSNNQLRLIYAGRIDKNKNIPTIQKTVQILREKGYDVSLTVVGKVEDTLEYEKIIKDKNTMFIPSVPKEKLIKFYRDAHIFTMPSFTESFGLVYVEAMSQGLPVIYTKGQGFDGQFEEGYVGFHVDSNNAFSVAEGIGKIIESYDSIAGNVVKASRKFNWDEIVGEYLKIYEGILRGEKTNAE